MEKDPSKDYEELMKAFEEGDINATQELINRKQEEIRQQQEAAEQQKQLPPTIIEGEVE